MIIMMKKHFSLLVDPSNHTLNIENRKKIENRRNPIWRLPAVIFFEIYIALHHTARAHVACRIVGS